MKNKLEFKVVDFYNVESAIKLQKEIFPNGDGTLNLLASIDRELFIKMTGVYYIDDKVKYYLVYSDNKLIGITGLYSYYEKWPNDVWLAWYGVLSKYRRQGYGTDILNWTINKSKELGYETIRLYTDIKENNIAVKLYKKLGFIEEKYDAEDLCFDSYIYSKNLIDNKVELWNNKKLNLSYQTELDHFDKIKIQDILNKYQKYINKV